MKAYLKKVQYFFLGIFLFTTAVVLIAGKHFAAPKLTTSYSFNEKLRVLPKSPVKILGIGSSMTFNNLISPVVVQNFEEESFFNTSSWGMTVYDVYHFSKILTEFYKPEKVIYVGNIQDFYYVNADNPKFEPNELIDFLHYRKYKYFFYYILNLDLNYYIQRTYENYENFDSHSTLSSLAFDEHGGVYLKKEGFEIPEERYNEKLYFDQIEALSYEYLDSLALLFEKNNITMYYLQSPLREGLIDSVYNAEINIHNNKVDRILSSRGHHFRDATHMVWEDEHFLDNTHMDSLSAARLTDLIEPASCIDE